MPKHLKHENKNRSCGVEHLEGLANRSGFAPKRAVIEDAGLRPPDNEIVTAWQRSHQEREIQQGLRKI